MTAFRLIFFIFIRNVCKFFDKWAYEGGHLIVGEVYLEAGHGILSPIFWFCPNDLRNIYCGGFGYFFLGAEVLKHNPQFLNHNDKKL